MNLKNMKKQENIYKLILMSLANRWGLLLLETRKLRKTFTNTPFIFVVLILFGVGLLCKKYSEYVIILIKIMNIRKI